MGTSPPPNQSLQRMWLSRILQVAFSFASILAVVGRVVSAATPLSSSPLDGRHI